MGDLTDAQVAGLADRIFTRADRITVTLIPKASEDLQRLQEATSLSKTDLVNRAITLYGFIDAQMRAGTDILARDSETGVTQVIRLL